MRANVSKRIFKISRDNRGLVCPFKPFICRQGCCCSECPIYLDWEEQGEKLVVCILCGEVMSRIPDFGRSVLSYGLCDECEQKRSGRTGR